MNIDNLITGGSSAAKRKPKSKQSRVSSNGATRKRPRKDVGINQPTENEDDLLTLALGSSSSGIRDADQYEESVLRNAELSNTPRLMATTNDESVAFGFPSLEGLVPSRSVHADLGNVRNVLAKLRKGTQTSSSVRLLTKTKDCLKEQMLLALMQSASGDFEMGVFPQQEAKQEWKRRKLHRSKTYDETIDPNMGNNNEGANRTNQRQQQSSLVGDQAETDIAHHEETPEGRLEGIKKGTKKKKSVRFSSDVKDPSRPKSLLSKKVLKLKPKVGRRRISIQERRRQEGGMARENEANEEDDGEITREEIVRHLKQLRIEREKRRKKRKQAWKDGNDSVDESEEEFEFTGNEETIESESQPILATADAIVPDTAGSSHHLSQICPAVPQESERDTIVCPLCGEQIDDPETTTRVKTEEGSNQINDEQDKSHRDAILAQHMSLCQTQRRSGRQKRAENFVSDTYKAEGLPIQSRRRNPRPNYTEAESDEENNSHIATATAHNNNDDDFRLLGDVEGEEEEELLDNSIEMAEDDKEIATAKPARSKTKPRRSSRNQSPKNPRRAPRHYPSPRSRSPPIDDWYEEDYEDRVDGWIENGLEKMPMMNERDEDEIPPGEEEYDGGLIVPAWINDRLFSYQRTGLQWMWELHRQQCGGILGDEMVSGMLGDFKLQNSLFLRKCTVSHIRIILCFNVAGFGENDPSRILFGFYGSKSQSQSHSHH